MRSPRCDLSFRRCFIRTSAKEVVGDRLQLFEAVDARHGKPLRLVQDGESVAPTVRKCRLCDDVTNLDEHFATVRPLDHLAVL